MQGCQVCGRSFDPLGFQVVVPELGRGFDRIECAQSARTLAGPGSRLAAAPLVAIVEPLPAAPHARCRRLSCGRCARSALLRRRSASWPRERLRPSSSG